MVCTPGVVPTPGKVCLFETSSFGNCSRENGYGYNNSSPCVFLKLNRIFNWVPEFYNDVTDLPSEMPQQLKDHIAAEKNKNQVWVSCGPEHPVDNEIVTEIRYSPGQGFSGEYYPYTNTPGYLSPLVAVQFVHPLGEWRFCFIDFVGCLLMFDFLSVAAHRIMNIECRAWAKNIQYRAGRERTGSVHFELMLD